MIYLSIDPEPIAQRIKEVEQDFLINKNIYSKTENDRLKGFYKSKCESLKNHLNDLKKIIGHDIF
jgi:hypothetical protein